MLVGDAKMKMTLKHELCINTGLIFLVMVFSSKEYKFLGKEDFMVMSHYRLIAEADKKIKGKVFSTNRTNIQVTSRQC